MKKIVIGIILVFIWTVAIWDMASATDVNHDKEAGLYELTNIDSDWTMAKSPINYILFYPGGVNDRLVLKNGSDTGPALMRVTSFDGGARIIYMDHKVCTPMLDFSECSLSPGASVTISAQ